MKKYLISLLKYIAGIIVAVVILVAIQLVTPKGNIELTQNEAIAFVIVGIIVMAVALKATFNLR